MCLRRAPEKYITGAALDRAGLDVMYGGECLLGLSGIERQHPAPSPSPLIHYAIRGNQNT
jgi:hypothetical protein